MDPQQVKGSGDFSIGSQVWPGTSKLLEEMGELQQVLGKLIATRGETAHWDGTDLRKRLVDELADVRAALLFFIAHNLSDQEQDDYSDRMFQKRKLFQAWHDGEAR